jgi:hypothetical protein
VTHDVGVGDYEKGFVAAVLFVEGIRSPSAEDVRLAVQTLAVFRGFERLRKY